MISKFVRFHPSFDLPGASSEQEVLFHRDQLGRYNHWRPEVWALKDLDLAAPKGSDLGPVLVLPASRVPVSGWATLRQALETGQDTVEVEVGNRLNLKWYPFSRQERRNAKLLEFVKSYRARSLGAGESQFLSKLKEWLEDPGIDVNAVDAKGRSVLDYVAGLYPSTGSRAAAQAIAWVIEAGALPNRLCQNPEGEEGEGRTIAQELLARFHVSAQLNDAHFALPQSLVPLFQMPQFDWSLPHNRGALEQFFSRRRPEVGLLEGAEDLEKLWRQTQLDLQMPAVRSAGPKPRF